MWEASYGKEPFDLRLTVLRLIRQWKQILLWIALGTVLFGGGYWLINYLFSGETYYQAESTYRVDYGVEDVDVGLVVINAATWDTYVHTQEFLEQVHSHLPEERQTEITVSDIKTMISGKLDSDWRVPSTRILTVDKDVCEYVAKAVEETMAEDFPKGISEVKSIRVIDPAQEAQEVIPDVRPGRAMVLGFVLSAFGVLILSLILEIGSDAVWLPGTLRFRYGLKVLGYTAGNELEENLKYILGENKRIAVCPVQEEINPNEIITFLKDNNRMDLGAWFCVPTPLLSPECAAKLREADGILLVVKAGSHAGKQTEYVLDYFDEQDCKVTAALLWEADECIIRWYYGFGKRERTDV